jgi:cytosine/adenosine deaminase-related metal-dependent hydrolase
VLPAEAITAATINAAWAIGEQDCVGSLEVGKQADVLVLDARNHEHLCYHFGVNLVDTVVKNGKIVVEGRQRLSEEMLQMLTCCPRPSLRRTTIIERTHQAMCLHSWTRVRGIKTPHRTPRQPRNT